MTGAKKPYKFDFAISFSGEDRSVAEELEGQLKKRGAVVFFYESYRGSLVGKRLDLEFADVFGPGTQFFVPIVSASYVERAWPQYEWNVAKREAEKRWKEFILPVRLDDSLLVGLLDTVCYLDLRYHPVSEVAYLLIEKLGDSTTVMDRQLGEQTWVAAFGLLTQDLLDCEHIPPEVSSSYAKLCDWLTEDLKGRLARTSLANPRVTEDARNGETFGLRLAFEWGPSKGSLQLGDLGWWELLELRPYNQVYYSELDDGLFTS